MKIFGKKVQGTIPIPMNRFYLRKKLHFILNFIFSITGKSVVIKTNTCINVPHEINDKTSSVNTHGGCVILCEDADCQGRCLTVGVGIGDIPGSYFLFILWNLNET